MLTNTRKCYRTIEWKNTPLREEDALQIGVTGELYGVRVRSADGAFFCKIEAIPTLIEGLQEVYNAALVARKEDGGT